MGTGHLQSVIWEQRRKDMIKKNYHSAQEWQQQLTPEAYSVTREAETEPPFSEGYWDHHEDGIYHCVCCGLPLFHSSCKFDSGTGWPSFYQPIVEENVSKQEDRSLFRIRTEALCAQCDAHLGHIFPETSQPTGMRYCINSAALNFASEE